MKKNRMMRLASILLVCVLLTTSVISGTFAKYTSTVAATDTARVAKWDWAFIIDEQSLTHNSGESVEFDLFNASQIMDLDNATGKVSENADDAVVDGLIAPGTGGKFNISVQNKSEVAANYTVALTATESTDLPIEYSLDNTTWKANISDLPISGDLLHSAVRMYGYCIAFAADLTVVHQHLLFLRQGLFLWGKFKVGCQLQRAGRVSVIKNLI